MKQAGKKAGRRAAAAACVLLAGCATPEIMGPASSSEVPGLFRTSSKVGGLAPAPTAGWYVSRQTPRYVKMGLARQAAPSPGGRLVRWLAPRSRSDAVAVIAETAALPLPSVVQITNVASGASMRVRIDERAPMGEDLLQLNAAAAQDLGVTPGRPLLVRVRFLEPAIAYRQGAPLAYAMGRHPKTKTELAAAASIAVAPVDTASEAPIITARLETPPAGQPAMVATAPPAPGIPVAPVRKPMATVEHALRIQAGAYANPGNARRAVALLSAAGQPQMRAVRRADGVTLYRVFVDCPGGARAAEILRAQVVKIGFTDARIVRAS